MQTTFAVTPTDVLQNDLCWAAGGRFFIARLSGWLQNPLPCCVVCLFVCLLFACVCVCWLSCLLVCRARTLLQLPPQMCLDKKFFFCSRGRAREPKIGVSARARARADPVGVRCALCVRVRPLAAQHKSFCSTSVGVTAKVVCFVFVCFLRVCWLSCLYLRRSRTSFCSYLRRRA